MNIFERLKVADEREALQLYLQKEGFPMTIIEQILAAFTALETGGSATIGPIDITQTANIFGQKITATESTTISLKKS